MRRESFFEELTCDGVMHMSEAMDALSELEKNTSQAIVALRSSQRIHLRTKVWVQPGDSGLRSTFVLVSRVAFILAALIVFMRILHGNTLLQVEHVFSSLLNSERLLSQQLTNTSPLSVVPEVFVARIDHFVDFQKLIDKRREKLLW